MMTSTHKRGYTLIELIVSIAIFSIVMLVATAAFLTLIDLDRRARATNDVVTNLSYVVESMERSIRTGTSYDCGTVGGATDCSSGNGRLNFVDYNGQNVTYLLKSNGTIGQCTSGSCTTSNATTLTDPRITIDTLTFYVIGSARKQETGDVRQPRVIFTISGSLRPRPSDPPITFTIESSATQRLIDL